MSEIIFAKKNSKIQFNKVEAKGQKNKISHLPVINLVAIAILRKIE